MIHEPIDRHNFCKDIPSNASLLEIGPYAKPMFRRPYHNVYYADMHSIEQIKENVGLYGHDASTMPDTIDIVMNPATKPTFSTDLRFDYIFSSHNIEHIPDIIGHLKEMAAVASGSNTKYYLAIPDKRYCFDHYQTLTHFPKMIEAHHYGIVKPSFRSVLENTVFMTHNSPSDHWQGIHGDSTFDFPAPDSFIEKIKDGLTKANKVDTEYVDTHCWQFIPECFFYNMDVLHRLGMIPWKVQSVFSTATGSNEFYAILKLS
jgi:hypothetical protein